MEFTKCSRCGNFYVSGGYVCPKCTSKDNLELSTLHNYILQNGMIDSLGSISYETGISEKNLNRFLSYPEFENYKNSID